MVWEQTLVLFVIALALPGIFSVIAMVAVNLRGLSKRKRMQANIINGIFWMLYIPVLFHGMVTSGTGIATIEALSAYTLMMQVATYTLVILLSAKLGGKEKYLKYAGTGALIGFLTIWIIYPLWLDGWMYFPRVLAILPF